MTVRIASAIHFLTDGIFLTRGWWKADFCHWMLDMVLTWGCYSPGRRSKQEGEKNETVFFPQHTNAIYSYPSFFLGFVEGLGREAEHLPLSRCPGKACRSYRVGSSLQGIWSGLLLCLWNESLLYNEWHRILSYWWALGILWCIFGKYSVITCNNLIFSVTPPYLCFNFSKISLSASRSP